MLTCFNKPVDFEPTINFSSYKWSDGDTTKSTILTTQGWYTLTVTDSSGCTASDSVYLATETAPVVNLIKDTTICVGSLTLDATTPDAVSYIWSNGVSTPTVTVEANKLPSFLSVTVENAAGCSTIDTVLFYACVNSEVPNAFIPDDPYQQNNRWKIKMLDEYPNASVEVFDRWGRRVFSCSNGYPSDGWDGTYNGKTLPMDAYFFIIKLNDGSKPISGSVTIIR